MSENEREREGWEDDSSSESKDKAELTLLMLDIEDTLESLSVAERESNGSIVMSCRYLKSWAHLKEQSTSSKSSSSLRWRGTCSMVTHSKKPRR